MELDHQTHECPAVEACRMSKNSLTVGLQSYWVWIPSSAQLYFLSIGTQVRYVSQLFLHDYLCTCHSKRNIKSIFATSAPKVIDLAWSGFLADILVNCRLFGMNLASNPELALILIMFLLVQEKRNTPLGISFGICQSLFIDQYMIRQFYGAAVDISQADTLISQNLKWWFHYLVVSDYKSTFRSGIWRATWAPGISIKHTCDLL